MPTMVRRVYIYTSIYIYIHIQMNNIKSLSHEHVPTCIAKWMHETRIQACLTIKMGTPSLIGFAASLLEDPGNSWQGLLCLQATVTRNRDEPINDTLKDLICFNQDWSNMWTEPPHTLAYGASHHHLLWTINCFNWEEMCNHAASEM